MGQVYNNSAEALLALVNGKSVRLNSWDSHKYVYIETGKLCCQDGKDASFVCFKQSLPTEYQWEEYVPNWDFELGDKCCFNKQNCSPLKFTIVYVNDNYFVGNYLEDLRNQPFLIYKDEYQQNPRIISKL
jgi:hypothetical protein